MIWVRARLDLKYLRTHLGAEFHFRGTSPSYVVSVLREESFFVVVVPHTGAPFFYFFQAMVTHTFRMLL